MIYRFKTWFCYLYNWLRFDSLKNRSVKDVFEDIYHNNKWSGYSFSGPGSDDDQTKIIRQQIPMLISRHKISTVLDIPCGDWSWMKHVDLSQVKYTGADIVESIIVNNHQYANDNLSFRIMDLLGQDIPTHDLILCRDCLVHFSYHEIRKALSNLMRSNSKYLLTTTFPNRTNYNIRTGNWRPINLEAFPFNLPRPIMIINENCTEGNGRFADKSLALWELEVLKKSLIL